MDADGREESGELLTVDELAAATGMTVRNTRYYAGLGLLPPPERRGRVAYYNAGHRARLELIRALQEHGFTLAAIERYLSRLPLDASPEELAIQRTTLTSWTAGKQETLTRRQLCERAGRDLSEDEIELLETMRGVRRVAGGRGDRFELLPPFETATQALTLGLPVESFVKASGVIGRHMDELVDELTGILREQILEPFRRSEHTAEEAAAFEATYSRLRQLTLEGLVAAFQLAADEVINRSVR